MKTILLMLFAGASFAVVAQDTTVTQLEYFFDADKGFGQNTLVNLIPVQDGTFPFTANISSLPVGYHQLYVRAKDTAGKWSQTTRRTIEVLQTESKVDIVSGEYFIDNDPGFGAGTPITVTPDSAILQNFTVVISGLGEGYHKLYGRLKDSDGKWSHTFKRNMEIYNADTTYVFKAEYFFTDDLGYGNCTQVIFANPSIDGTFSFNIPLSEIPAGSDTLFIRAQDSSNYRWSITRWQDISFALPLTLLDFTATKQNMTAQLNWQTANEVNTDYFNVQRSLDGTNFSNVGKVAAKGTSGKTTYVYDDNIANLKAGKIFYRLQMLDIDGKFTYSKIAYITVNGDGRISLLPNPAHGYFLVSYNNADVTNGSIIVRDLAGRAIISQKLNNSTQQKVSVSSLPKGVYMVSIITEGHVQTEKLVVE